MRVALLAAVGALLAVVGATRAEAQTYPISGPVPMPYQSLSSSATAAPSSFQNVDWDYYWYGNSTIKVALPTGFTFRYWGTTYSHLHIGGNGAIVPGTSSSSGSSSTYDIAWWTYPLGYTSSPRGPIAPWMDDWARGSASPHPGGIFYEVVGTAPNRVFKVEWRNVNHYSCNSAGAQPNYAANDNCAQQRSYSFQAWLFEAPSSGSTNSTILFSYAQPIGPAPANLPNGGDATGFNFSTTEYYYYGRHGAIGLQNPTSYSQTAVPSPFVSCGRYPTNHPNYSWSPACYVDVHWPANQMFLFGTLSETELVASPALASFASTATQLELSVNTSVYNLGTTAASGIGWNLYLSNDQAPDLPGSANPDIALTDANVPAIHSVTSRGSVSAVSGMTVPRPADGWYYVCAHVDPNNLVAERIEGNNASCSASGFLVGKDLVGSVSPPAFGAPGEHVGIPIQIKNLGSDPIGPFNYEIFFSANNTLDLGDERMHTGTISLPGSGVYQNTEQVWVPANISGNTYYVILVIDRAGQAPELDDTNNISVSAAQMVLIKPDLKPDQVQVDVGFGCYFGAPVTVSYEVCNNGIGNAWNFINATFLSSNAVITGNDVQTDASPQSCNSGLDSECSDIGAGQPFCYLGACHAPCATDVDCGDPGLVCLPDRDVPLINSCQQHIGPNSCKTYTREFLIPTHDRNGFIMQEGEYFVGVITDATDRVNEENEGNQIKAYSRGFECRHPRSDLTAVSVIPPSRMAAGEVSSVYRVIKNIGNVAGTASYRYFLSSNETVSTDDIPLAIEGHGLSTEVSIDSFGESRLSDLLSIPDNVVAGEYYLGLLVDPAGDLHELDEDNNVIVSTTKVRVEPAALRIATTTLPDATVGGRYVAQLVASGGDSEHQWALTGGNLPLGIELTPDGLLSGSAGDEGTYVFGVRVTSGSATATALLALRVGAPMGNLAVSTEILPPAVLDTPYSVYLAATGGVPPYSWSTIGGLQQLNEAGMSIDSSGLISGSPVHSGTLIFTVEVKDTRSNRAQRELTLTIVDAADLVIISQRFNEAQVGLDYFGCATASGGADGEYVWTVDPSTVPAGLAVNPNGTRVCLTGEPQVCGSFTVDVTVEDESGQIDSAQLPMTIVCERVGLATTSLPTFKRGELVDVQLEATTDDAATMRLFAGRLPDGVTLDPSGRLVGDVSDSAPVGTYNFVIEVSTDAGGYGLSALTFTVVPEPWKEPEVEKPVESGCSATGGSPAGLLPVGLALLGLATIRRRRD